MTLRRVCSADELWEGEKLLVQFEGRGFLLMRLTSGAVRAVQPNCPHQGHPLIEGTFDGQELTCPFHLWRFNVCDGKGVNPTGAKLRLYPVEILNDEIYIDLRD